MKDRALFRGLLTLHLMFTTVAASATAATVTFNAKTENHNNMTQFSLIDNNSAIFASPHKIAAVNGNMQKSLFQNNYVLLPNTLAQHSFSNDDILTGQVHINWHNDYFSTSLSHNFFSINNYSSSEQLRNDITASAPITHHYYTTGLAAHNKSKTIMATLAYEIENNSNQLGYKNSNIEADISFYNPYKYFSRLNLNYKKNIVGLAMSQLGIGITFYGDLSFSIISSLDMEDINNNQFPKRLYISFGISHSL